MSKARIYILEDEPIIREDIVLTLEEAEYEVVGKAARVDLAYTAISKAMPDLVILDINVDGKEDGIDLGRKLHSELKTPFIYLTSYYDKETVSRAKQTFPAAYIIKPFEENDLLLNVELALFKSKQKPIEKPATNKLFVKKQNELVALVPDDIVYVEAEDNYANVYTIREKYVLSHTLKKVEAKLSSFGFVRIHKSYLVNFEKINMISEGYLYLENYQLPIGKAFRGRLHELLITL
jgi:DNA-binding LytR/AlgR family response regulator